MQQARSFSVDTDWGSCRLAWTDRGLARLRLQLLEVGDAEAPKHATGDAPPPAALACIERLRAYFTGAVVDFGDIPLDQSGLTAMDAAIYAVLRAVPFGRTTTYGELPEQAGHPGAARAVGVAMARNPWPIVVPCHRVLAKHGMLGGFSAPGGVLTKRRLLELERAKVESAMPTLPGLFDGP
jgi:methylated-DNA-[protein]-cysteine S-methyltransferase